MFDGIFGKKDTIADKFDRIVNQKVNSILEGIEINTQDGDNPKISIKSGPRTLKGKKIINHSLSAKDFTIPVKKTQYSAGKNGIATTIISSPYDYNRIDRFFQKESYFSRAVSRQFETLLRNGFGYISDSQKYITKVKTRIAEIEKANGNRLEQTFAKIYMDLSKWGISVNQKIYKTYPSGKKKLKSIRNLHPSGCTFYFDTNTGEFLGIDISGASGDSESLTRNLSPRLMRILAAATRRSNRMPSIPAEELIILKVYQDDVEFFPEPPSMQMLDDILTLRSIEETIELLIFQYGSPILHGKVGTPEDPARPGEVDIVRSEVENMASNGFVVTDDRVTFTPINLLSNAGDFANLLSYFKTRILIGAGSSGISVGEGDTSNRSTANSIDDGMADHCMYYGGIISFMMNYEIIPEILAEGSDKKSTEMIIDEDGDLIVEHKFNEVKLEKQISMENSVINLFNANLMPHGRAMKKLKMLPLSPEEVKDLYLNKIQIPLAEAGKAAQGSSPASASSGNSPSNQHGKKSGPGSTEN